MAAQQNTIPVDLELAAWIQDARQRTLALIADLADEQLLGPRLALVNPLLWEIGHVAWFQEKWVLRHAGGHKPIRADADALYDSAAVPHDTRWDLPLPSRADTLGYMQAVCDRILDQLRRREPTVEEAYFVLLSIFHEDMHTEAFLYARQTLGYPAPRLSPGPPEPAGAASSGSNELRSGEVAIPGGTFWLGAPPQERFVFDNEKWAHPVAVRPFAIARTPVTQAEFAAFVEEGGYERPELWSTAGWEWRQRVQAVHPVYWKRAGAGRWWRRHFNRWLPLEPNYPMIHVNWHEADAYCRWSGRRLPTELEWEVAAAAEPDSEGPCLSPRQRRFPWGNEAVTPPHANLDGHALGCIEVAALPAGDSAFGCRQLIGNVWEWTQSDFLPYPDFVADPYKEYSQPWFGTHKVLRGGCWATRARLLRTTYRNFYTPDRRDIWSGFRTCRLPS